MLPIEVRVDHDTFRHAGGAITAVHVQVSIVAAETIRKDRLLPVDVAVDGLRIRIDQQFRRIEAQTIGGVPGSINPVPVKLARSYAWQITMPHEGGLLANDNTLCLAPGANIVKAKLHLDGVLGIERKIHTRSVPGCP